MVSWVTAIGNAIKNTELSVEISGIKFYLKCTKPHQKNHIDNLSQLLKQADFLLQATLMRGIQLPVFYIYEANSLRTILRDKEGQAALQMHFEWLVMHIKEKNHFHVVLASSDSFFSVGRKVCGAQQIHHLCVRPS